MADTGVYDRWTKTVDGKRVQSECYGEGKRWQARWRDEAGRQRKRNCERKAEAERFLSGIKADLARGIYVNPAAGKARLREYAGGWLAVQTFDLCVGLGLRQGEAFGLTVDDVDFLRSVVHVRRR